MRSTYVEPETFAYHAPRLRQAGKIIDMGLVAEALVFYDRVYLGTYNPEHVAHIVSWFVSQGRLSELLALFRDRTLAIHHYAFYVAPVLMPGGYYKIWNMQEPVADPVAHFHERIIHHPQFEALVQPNVREQFEAVVSDGLVAVKAEDYGGAVQSAWDDYSTRENNEVLLQILVDEMYHELGYLKPPGVRAKVKVFPDSGVRVRWNLDLDRIKLRLGDNLAFSPAMPFTGAAVGSRAVWTAARLGTDLYLAPPLSSYVRYKLAQGNRAARAHAVIHQLEVEANFPDVRRHVNDGDIGLEEVLALRGKANRFREWLRAESLLERDAAAAYLDEAAKAAGWAKAMRTGIVATGMIGGAVLGEMIAGVGGAAIGAGAGFLADLGAKLIAGWRPIVFGDYARKVIDRAIAESNESS